MWAALSPYDWNAILPQEFCTSKPVPTTPVLQLEEMKLSSVTKQSKWPVVDDLEISASQANARQERARAKYEKSCQLLVELQAGVEHLYEKLTSALSSHVRLSRARRSVNAENRLAGNASFRLREQRREFAACPAKTVHRFTLKGKLTVACRIGRGATGDCRFPLSTASGPEISVFSDCFVLPSTTSNRSQGNHFPPSHTRFRCYGRQEETCLQIYPRPGLLLAKSLARVPAVAQTRTPGWLCEVPVSDMIH